MDHMKGRSFSQLLRHFKALYYTENFEEFSQLVLFLLNLIGKPAKIINSWQLTAYFYVYQMCWSRF